MTSEPNDGDPKACPDPAPSAAIVEFLLYDTQRLELEECAVYSLWRNAYMSLVVFLLARIFGDKAPCRTIIRNHILAFPWHSLCTSGILYLPYSFSLSIIRSPIKTMQEWHLLPLQKVVHNLTIRTLIFVSFALQLGVYLSFLGVWGLNRHSGAVPI